MNGQERLIGVDSRVLREGPGAVKGRRAGGWKGVKRILQGGIFRKGRNNLRGQIGLRA